MKFTAIKQNLTDGLSVVQKALSSKNTVPMLSGIYLRAAEGRLTMTATDMEIRISISVPVQVLEPGETIVQGKSFADLIRRLPDVVIAFENVSRDGNDYMTITYGEASAKMNGWPGREFPMIPEQSDEKTLTIPAETLQGAVSQTAFTVNPEEVRPVFTGLLFEVRGHQLTMVGTDSFRLALYRCALNNADEVDHDLIIPVRALNEIARIASADSTITLRISDRQVIFEVDDVTLVSQLLRGDYPPYDRVIPDNWHTYLKINRKVLQQTIDRAMLFSQEKDGTSVINCSIENNVMRIHTGSEYGQVDEKLPIYQEGDAVEISFNARFVADALKAMHYEELDVTMNGSLGPSVFRPQADDSFLYLLLPLRR